MGTIKWSLKKGIQVIAVADVLVAAILITAYVWSLAEHLHVLELMQASKSEQIVLYAFVSITTTVQIFVAFRYYRVLANDREPEEVDELLRMSKCWIYVSCGLVLTWVIKSGIYAERRHGVSIPLILCLIEVLFRICAICTVKVYVGRLTEIERQRQMEEIENRRAINRGLALLRKQ